MHAIRRSGRGEVTGTASILASTGLLLGGLGLIGVVRGFSTDYQFNYPWEVGEITEAWRLLHGFPIYEPVASGHATHMYGALYPALLVPFLAVAGPNPFVARLLALVSAVCLIALLLFVAQRVSPRPAWLTIFVAALFIATDGPTWHYFAVVRPDMPELLIATGALILTWRGVDRARFSTYLLGCALLVAAFFVKQSAAFLAPIPAIGVMLERRWPLARRLAWATLPFAMIVLAVVAIRAFSPSMFFHMIALPAQYRIESSRMLQKSAQFIGSLAVVWVSVALWLAAGAPGHEKRAVQWALVSTAVAVPTSALAVGKHGGWPNSWLPAYFAAFFLLALLLPILDASARVRARSANRTTIAAILAGLALVGFIDVPLNAFGYLGKTLSGRSEMITLLRQLPAGARVASMQDPTVLIAARGVPDRTIAFEFDAHPTNGRVPSQLPGPAARNIATADYLVRLDEWYPLSDSVVNAAGFVELARRGSYSLWGRRQTARTDFPMR